MFKCASDLTILKDFRIRRHTNSLLANPRIQENRMISVEGCSAVVLCRAKDNLFVSYHRPDRVLQDIVYKLVPGLCHGKSYIKLFCYQTDYQGTQTFKLM